MRPPTISERRYPHVRVRLSPSATGKIWIDGKEVPNVKSVTIRGSAGANSEIELELTGVEIEVDVGESPEQQTSEPKQ